VGPSHSIEDPGHNHGLPELLPEREVGPDDPEDEGEFDRDGNEDPGTNQPPAPEEDLFPEMLPKPAAEEQVPHSVLVTEFNYLSIGGRTGRLRAVGTTAKGAAFSLTEEVPPNVPLQVLLGFVEDLRRRFGQ